ncbi:unnamed protein product, partial [Ceratitis capitata]
GKAMLSTRLNNFKDDFADIAEIPDYDEEQSLLTAVDNNTDLGMQIIIETQLKELETS